MKAFYCRKCTDIQQIWGKKRKCACGKSGGWLKDKEGLKALFWGEAIPIAIANQSLLLAKVFYEKDKRTTFIQAWSIDPTQEQNDVEIK